MEESQAGNVICVELDTPNIDKDLESDNLSLRDKDDVTSCVLGRAHFRTDFPFQALMYLKSSICCFY